MVIHAPAVRKKAVGSSPVARCIERLLRRSAE